MNMNKTSIANIGIYNENAEERHLKKHHLTAEEILTKMKKNAIGSKALSKVKSKDLFAIYSCNDDMVSMITDAYLLGFYKGMAHRNNS